LESRFTHTTVSPGHRALACASVENWPAAVGAAAAGGRVVVAGGVADGAAAVEGCLGAPVAGVVVGAAVDGLAGAAAGGGVAGDGAAVVVEAPAGCRHSAMNSFFVFLLA